MNNGPLDTRRSTVAGRCQGCGCEVYGVAISQLVADKRVPAFCGDCERAQDVAAREARYERQRSRQTVRAHNVAPWGAPGVYFTNDQGQRVRISLLPTAKLLAIWSSSKWRRWAGISEPPMLLGVAREVLIRARRGVGYVAPSMVAHALQVLPDPCVTCGKPGTRIVGLRCFCVRHAAGQRNEIVRQLDERKGARDAARAEDERVRDRAQRHHEAVGQKNAPRGR